MAYGQQKQLGITGNAKASGEGAGAAKHRRSGDKTARNTLEKRRKIMARQLAPRLCLASASACTQAPVAALLQPSRGPRAVAQARRFGMAMLVLGFGFSLTRAGHVLRRDRTTARHARDLFLAAPESHGHRIGLRRLDPAMKLWMQAMLEAGVPEASS